MDYTYILNTSIPQNEKLKEFGFSKVDEDLVLKKDISNGDFYAQIRLTDKTLVADVFESSTNEKYVLYNVASAQGSFVSQLRREVLLLIEEIRDKCFISADIKQKYVDYLHSHFNEAGDNPWEGDFDSTVYRCPDSKWFALVMKIRLKSLGFESEESVWAVNLKAADSSNSKIGTIVDNKTIFPAYHMNKKYWITVLLTAATDFQKLCVLTDRSFELVSVKK